MPPGSALEAVVWVDVERNLFFVYEMSMDDVFPIFLRFIQHPRDVQTFARESVTHADDLPL